tara:strand:- start:2293 stop:3372 length:1080 start_codon:yes stop_codon:yes gene_type:complete
MAKLSKLSSSISIVFIILGCSTDSDSSLSETNNSVSETFGSWSPDFTDQKTNFDQNRTGSNGTQQTRTISVSSGSNSEVTTEKNLTQDINQDDDLFDEIEKVIITYTASENLGSFQEINYNLAEDNNNGITIGNDFYSIHNGVIVVPKYVDTEDDWLDNGNNDELNCNGVTLKEVSLALYSNELSYSVGELYGFRLGSESRGGTVVFMDLMSIYENDINLNDGVEAKYYDFIDIFNQSFGTSFNSQNNTEDEYECTGYSDEVEDQIDAGLTFFDDDDPCAMVGFIYQTATSMYYDISYNSDAEYHGADYCEGVAFDTIGSSISITKNQDDTYIVEFVGKDQFSLPMKLYYNGFLAIDIN